MKVKRAAQVFSNTVQAAMVTYICSGHLPQEAAFVKNMDSLFAILTRFNKIAIQGTPQMAVDKEAISLSRVYLYDSKYTCPYSMCNPP